MAATETAEDSRVQATLAFLKGSIAPELYNIAPPNIEPRGQILKDVTINGQLQVLGNSILLPTGEQIPNTSGMVLWLVNRGVNSIYRMNFVPSGTTSQVGGSGAGSSAQLRGLVGPIANPAVGVDGPNAFNAQPLLQSLTYIQQLALPVFNDATDIIQLKPDLPDEVSYTRLYSGFVSCVSATVSIGNTALTGTFSAASVEDTRDIAQNVGAGAFSVTNIMQSAESIKDGIYQVKTEDGVLALVASDIPFDFTNPNVDNVIKVEGNYTQYTGNPFQYYSTYALNGNAATWVSNTELQYGAYWITPWAISAATNATQPQAGASVTQIYTPPIAECGTLRIKINVPCCLAAQVGSSPTITTAVGVSYYAKACHVFATCSTQGWIGYSCWNQSSLLTTQCAGNDPPLTGTVLTPSGFTVVTNGTVVSNIIAPGQTGSLVPSAAGYGFTAEFRPLDCRTSFEEQGKYLGTYISLTIAPTSGNTSTGGWCNGANDCLFVGFGQPTFFVAADDIDAEGQTGPARILRWDNLSAGMQINVAGKLWVQAIPSAKLAPYVKQQIMMQNRWCSEDAIRLLAALTEGPTPFRRVWNLQQYRKFVTEQLEGLTLDALEKFAQKDQRIAEALHGAGLLRAIDASLGGYGRTMGGVGAGNFGAAGQFGAIGQFGGAGTFRPRMGAYGQF